MRATDVGEKPSPLGRAGGSEPQQAGAPSRCLKLASRPFSFSDDSAVISNNRQTGSPLTCTSGLCGDLVLRFGAMRSQTTSEKEGGLRFSIGRSLKPYLSTFLVGVFILEPC